MKKKGGLITMIVVILIVALLFGAYQWFRFPAAFRNLSDESLSAEQVNERKEELKAKEDKKVLVAYFSYSGTTRGVAETLSSQIGADLFEIAPKEDYTSLYLRSNMEIRRGEKPELSSEVENMEEYDIVFVGYPVWFHATPAPINSFLESYDLTGKTIIPFTTHGGSGFSRTIQAISELQPGATVLSDGLSISRNSVANAENDVVQWVSGLDLSIQ